MTDIDLAEYDQVDDVKILRDLPQNDGPLASVLVALSSSSDHDEQNCENDFVFLPEPPEPSAQAPPVNLKPSLAAKRFGQFDQAHEAFSGDASGGEGPSAGAGGSSPLAAINMASINSSIATRAKNPFYNLSLVSAGGVGNRQPESSSIHQTSWMMKAAEFSPGKPIGPLELATVCQPTSSSVSPSEHLADLMHQIVTRSDSIYITIPCSYCHESFACPPSDISRWLEHMSKSHNCKVCPICNRLIGLGPRKDLAIIRRHVISHIDDDWLERRSNRTTFTFGLQQQWFPSSRCQAKEPRTS